MKFYSVSAEASLAEVSSRPEGLTAEEAERRLGQYGSNRLQEGKKDPVFKQLLRQIADPMILILIAAAIVSGITAAYSGESFADVVIILFVVVVNAVLGVYQESKAEKAIEALQEMAAATSRVRRSGKVVTVRSEELVPGDVVLLEAGDAVPADGRLLESASLKIEEAALTGESVPVSKFIEAIGAPGVPDVPLGDRKNMAYMGSTVVYGRGSMVVTGTGMNTEMGRIADALAQTQEGKTPLQRKLAQLSKVLTVIVLGICAAIFAVGVLRAGELSGSVLLNTFMVAVSLAVAAIPEGLAAVVTIVLSIGVTNMSRRSAIIRRLTAVETLGCTQIICTDKTGTLTQNRMTVVERRTSDEALLARALALCSDSEWNESENRAEGEPTENALVDWAAKIGVPKPELEKTEPRVGELPFDSSRKMMSTFHRTASGFVQYTKGAPDEVLARCTKYLESGEQRPLTDEKRAEILRENGALAQQALRVLMGAYREMPELPPEPNAERDEAELCYIGLVGMIDPVRPEVKDAIDECRDAGIRPIMITGDHIDTASAIARQLGILTPDTEAASGAQLEQMDDEVFAQRFRSISVYARVQPEHKTRIVNAWRAAGYITAMTGDGVNDAPSIKAADIGVGMGITGTDVTKNVADMVLADDNFATIVAAVEEGRRIYDNIRRSIQFLLGSNLSEVLSVFTATMLGFTILKPVHLLWINLVTDSFPALALGMEKAERSSMQRPPRNAADGIFSGGLGTDVAYQGVVVTCLTLLAYFLGHFMESGVWEIASSPDGMTMAFLAMSMAEIFHCFNVRSQRGSLLHIGSSNRVLDLAALASLLCTTLVIYVPFLANAFEFEHISLLEYAAALGLAFCVIPIVELVKAVQRAVLCRGAK